MARGLRVGHLCASILKFNYIHLFNWRTYELYCIAISRGVYIYIIFSTLPQKDKKNKVVINQKVKKHGIYAVVTDNITAYLYI